MFNFLSSCKVKGDIQKFIYLRNISSLVYFIHVALIILIGDMFPELNNILTFVLVTVTSIAISMLVIKLSSCKKLKIIKKLY